MAYGGRVGANVTGRAAGRAVARAIGFFSREHSSRLGIGGWGPKPPWAVLRKLDTFGRFQSGCAWPFPGLPHTE